MYDSGIILDVGADAPAGECATLEHLGHRIVAGCGPVADGGCSMVESGSCPLAESADGILFRLDLDHAYHRRILQWYRAGLGGVTPLHVVAPAAQERRHGALLAGLTVSHGGRGESLAGFSAQVAMAAAARAACSGWDDVA